MTRRFRKKKFVEKTCSRCGAVFTSWSHNAIRCPECRKKHHKEYLKQYNSSPRKDARQVLYCLTNEEKHNKIKKENETPKIKNDNEKWKCPNYDKKRISCVTCPSESWKFKDCGRNKK